MTDAEPHFRTFVRLAVQKSDGSQQTLAERLGCSQQQISYLLHQARSISAEMAIAFDREFAPEITKEMLRPDLFGPPANADQQSQGAAA